MRKRREGDLKCYERACRFEGAQHSGQIVSIRQRARTGTKAYIRWSKLDYKTGIWFPFPQMYIAIGQYVSVSGQFSYGQHHDEEVFYVHTVIDRFTDDVYKRARRHVKYVTRANRQR